MALLLLLLGGFWAQLVSPEETTIPDIKVSSTFKDLNFSTTMSAGPVSVESTSTRRQTPTPLSSTLFGTSELSSLGTPTGTSVSTLAPEPTTQKVSNKTILTPEPSNTTSDPPATIALNSLEHSPVTDRTVTVTSLETSKGTSAPPVTMTTSSDETSGPSVATTVSSKTSGPPVTMVTGSPESSSETHGFSATIATSSVESSSVADGTPVSGVKISTMSTPEPVTTRTPRKESSGMLLVPMLVALLLVLVLLALLLLWRRRQKRRTGALTLNGGGKRNGVVDAWAGPARVPDEEATTAASGPAGNKGSGVQETEGSGQRPTLTTFFSRRKSRQGSLALEELKSGSGPSLKGEEEPLVGSENEAVETPTSEGLETKDGAAPQCI